MQYQTRLREVGLTSGEGLVRRTEALPEETAKAAISAAAEGLLKFCDVGRGEIDQTRDAVFDELLRIHEYERQRLGQELHDSAGQLLVALQLGVAHLRRLETTGHETLIEEVQDTIRQIDRQIRSLAFLHYPAELDERGLCSAVAGLVRGFDRRTGIHTSFRVTGEVDDAGPMVSEALLRVAQECLVNVHRHARATAAKVQIERRNEDIRLSVSDNGVGICCADANLFGKGVGLHSMLHRVQAFGGKLKLLKLKRGVKIVATIPSKAAVPLMPG